jgi:hypothetical protein
MLKEQRPRAISMKIGIVMPAEFDDFDAGFPLQCAGTGPSGRVSDPCRSRRPVMPGLMAGVVGIDPARAPASAE